MNLASKMFLGNVNLWTLLWEPSEEGLRRNQTQCEPQVSRVSTRLVFPQVLSKKSAPTNYRASRWAEKGGKAEASACEEFLVQWISITLYWVSASHLLVQTSNVKYNMICQVLKTFLNSVAFLSTRWLIGTPGRTDYKMWGFYIKQIWEAKHMHPRVQVDYLGFARTVLLADPGTGLAPIGTVQNKDMPPPASHWHLFQVPEACGLSVRESRLGRIFECNPTCYGWDVVCLPRAYGYSNHEFECGTESVRVERWKVISN